MFHFNISRPGKAIYLLVLAFIVLMIIGFLGKAIFRGPKDEASSGGEEADIVINNNTIGAHDYKWILENREQSEDDAGDDTSISVTGQETQAAGGISIAAWQPFQASGIPEILIYHTHTFEAYRKAGNSYSEIADARTRDNRYNVVAIGTALAAEFLNHYGVQAMHDTANHEEPELATAYARSLDTLNEYKLKENQILIDIHRDAFSQSSWDPEYVVINGQKVARIMFVVGKGANYDEQPAWRRNLAFAQAITDELNRICPGLAREVKIKDGRYNQHLSPNAVLIEVGHHENTLQEALNAVPYLAEAIMNVVGDS